MSSLKIIGAGFGRTGTDSMREALEILGFGPCHHMIVLNKNEEQRMAWRSFLAKDEPPDWDVLLGGFQSCVDWPAAHYWRELAAAYPEAKVLLTVRDAEDWYDSAARTIVPVAIRGRTEAPESVGALVDSKFFNGRFDDREYCIRKFKENTQAVLDEIPAERRLVYKVGDGWEPLCAFLDVPVPDAPFPHSNTTAAFLKDRESTD
ncbi:MAG TPA: sulfotransferase [Paracoccaceae bacterium]|nr:sulfotransferase [Paracoccaceae bacterium]